MLTNQHYRVRVWAVALAVRNLTKELTMGRVYCLAVAWIVGLATPGFAEEKLVSPDKKVVATVTDDDTIMGLHKESDTEWTFPPADEKKGKLHKAAFAPLKSPKQKDYKATLLIAYGNHLYATDGKGGLLWKNVNQVNDKDRVTFTFVEGGDLLTLKVGDATSQYRIVDGRKVDVPDKQDSPEPTAGKLVSPDKKVVATIKDNTIVGLDKESDTEWTYPAEADKKRKLHKAAFAAASSEAHKRFGPTLLVAYGRQFVVLDRQGKVLWSRVTGAEDDDRVTMMLENDTVILRVGETTSKYRMHDGTKVE